MDPHTDYKQVELAARRRRAVRRAVTYVLLALWAVIVLFPFYWMVLTSVKSYSAYSSERIPAFFTLSPTLQNYRDAFTAVPLGRYFLNTVIFTVATTAIMLVVIVFYMIGDGLNYGRKPKGLVTFHAYPEGARKAVEEHLVEGAVYAAARGVARIHFTVSPEHIAGFETLLAEKVPVYEQRFGIRYDISFSVQKPSTDTIAVNSDNTPFRQDDGTLLFRPAGHGALVENLNEIDADLVFIKNIDNVTTDAQRGDTIRYKKVLAGILLDLQDRAFEYLKALEVGGAELEPIVEFIEQRLCVKLPADYDSALLRAVLDRPIRVCGMVRNEGEPGGGPFWASNADGTQSLQIAESSQIAPADQPLMKAATHFNPVDLVCGVRDSKGRKFDLRRYTDPATGFISSKSSGGRELRAQELPGLWNGTMSRWNTIFVDVPITTFSPVKVVQDLLRPQHQ